MVNRRGELRVGEGENGGGGGVAALSLCAVQCAPHCIQSALIYTGGRPGAHAEKIN